MEVKKENLGVCIRLCVTVHTTDGKSFEHGVSRLAMPSPDGRYFMILDVSAGEKIDKNDSSVVETFYQTALVARVVTTKKRFYIMPDGRRGEEVLDKEQETPQITLEEK